MPKIQINIENRLLLHILEFEIFGEVKYNDLFSESWCKILFEGRNKDYGAYILRTTAGKRYFKAYLGIIFFSIFVSLSIYIISYLKNIYQINLETLDIKNIEMQNGFKIKDLKPIGVVPPKRKKLNITKDNQDESQSFEIAKNPIKEFKQLHFKNVIIPKSEESSLDFSDDLLEATKDSFPKDTVSFVTPLLPHQLIEDMPQYPGGWPALARFFSESISYPKSLLRKHICGEVIVTFHIDKNGVASHFEITKSLLPECDEEVLTVCKKMPKWIPNSKNTNASKFIKISIPIIFDGK